MKNPFELLGLSPEIVRTLDGKELFALIRSAYRALIMIYHPDRAPLGNEPLKNVRNRKVAELNLAFEKLNHDRDPDSMKHFKELYVRRLSDGWQKTIRKLNRDIQELTRSSQTLSENYLRFLLEPGFTRRPPESADHATLYNLNNWRLGLRDLAINHNVRSPNWNLGTNYKEIKIDPEGHMFYKLPNRKRFIPVNFIRLLGTVDKEQVDLVPLLDRVLPRDFNSQSRRWKTPHPEHLKCFDVMNTLAFDDFRRHCLPYLKPELQEGSYLFSIHRTVPQQDRISLEGLIIRLNPGKSSKTVVPPQ
jgi:curved DNA-binding protein CbpA